MTQVKHFLPSDWENGNGYGEPEVWNGEEVVILDRDESNSVVVPVREDVVICDSDRDYNYEPKKGRR